MKILYVEDEVAHIELVRRTLQASQVEFLLDSTGYINEALLKLNEIEYDVVLCDFRLPDGTGLDLIKAVQEFTSPPAIVIITNQGDDEIAISAFKAGAVDYVVKKHDYLNRLPVVLTNAVAQIKIRQQQKALQESQDRYRSLVEKIPAVVFLDDFYDASISHYMSPKIFELTGYSPEEWAQGDAIWENSLHPEDKDRVLREDVRSSETGEVFYIEYRLRRKDGEYRWVREEAQLLLDEQGKPRYWQGILLDITEEKSAADAILQSEEKFLKIFQSSPIAICITRWDDGVFLDVNSAYCEYTGFYRDELIGRSIIDVTGVSVKGRADFLQHLQVEGSLLAVEDEINISAGKKRLALAFYETLWLGNQRCILSMLYDITEQKIALTALNKRDSILSAVSFAAQQFLMLNDWRAGIGIVLEKLGMATLASRVYVFNLTVDADNIRRSSQIFEWVRDGIVAQIANPNLQNQPIIETGRVAWIELLEQGQPVLLNWTEYSAEEKKILEVQGIYSLVSVPIFVEQKLWGYIGYDECVDKDRSWLPSEVDALLVAGNLLGSAIQREISDNALKAERDFASNILNSMAQGLTVSNKDGVFEYVNPAFAKMIGKTSDELIGQSPEETSSEERKEILAEEKERRSQGITSSYRNHLIHQDGREIPVRVTGSPRWVDGQISGTIAVITDLTEQEQAGQALRASEVSFRDLFNTIGQAVYIQNKEGQFLDVNDGAAVMSGYPREALLGKTLSFLSSPNQKSIEKIAERIKNAFDGEPQHFEFLGLRSTGEIFPCDIHFYKGNYFGQQVVIALVEDVTDRKAVERTVWESNKILQRQLRELVVLHNAAQAEAQGISEDEIITNVVITLTSVYPDVCGALLINEAGNLLIPHPSYVGANVANWTQGYTLDRGITGRSASTGKSVIIYDLAEESNYIEIATDIHSELCVPIRVNEKVIGVLNVESHEIGMFTEGDERFLATIADGLGSALERIRLLEVKQIQLEHEAAIVDLMKIGASSLDLNLVLQSLLNQLLKLIPSDFGSVQLLEREDLRLVATFGFKSELFNENELFPVINFPINKQVIYEKRLKNIPDVTAESSYIQMAGAENIRAFMIVPLIYKERIIGLITLDSNTPSRYTQADENLAIVVADHISVAVENARLYETERKRSKIIETFAEITNKIATSRDVLPILDDVIQQGASLLTASHMAVYLLQDDECTLKIVSAEGKYRDQLLSHTIVVGQGITGNVVLNKLPEVVNDFAKDSRSYTVPETSIDEGRKEIMMSAPLLLRDKAIGAINAWRMRVDGNFDESELNFLISIAHQISVAVEASRLFEETLRREKEAEAIAEVGRGISETLQLNIVMERVALYSKELMHTETSAVYMVEEGNDILRAIAAFGEEAEEIKNDPLKLGDGILGSIALSKIAEIVNNTEHDSRTVIVKDTQVASDEYIMGAPILFKEKLVGLIAVWRTGPGLAFKAYELDFLVRLAQQAAIAIENARLYHETYRQLDEQEMISRFSNAMRSAKGPHEMLPILLAETKKIIDTDSVSIWMHDPINDVLVQKLASGIFENLPNKEFKPTAGIIGRVFMTGEPYISDDLFADPMANREVVAHYGVGWSAIVVPIQAGTKTIGGIGVALGLPRKITQNYVYILSTLAEIAGSSIYRAELFESTVRQVHHLTTLREIDSAIASSFDLKVTLNILLDYMLKEMGVDGAVIFEYQQYQNTLTFVAGRGFDNTALGYLAAALRDPLSADAFMNRNDVYIEDLSVDSAKKHLVVGDYVSYYGVPLVSKGQGKGVLEAFFKHSFVPTADWVDFVRTLAGQATIALDNSNLFDNLQRSKQELEMAYDTTLEGWGKALELRDKETQGHTRRVTDLTLMLARQMNIGNEDLIHIYRGALLHDIGKMGVPDHILRKAGKLDDDEWLEMHKHPRDAYDLLLPIAYLRPALDIPYCHHEYWDGSGYPRGLKAEEIPLAARIFAVVDVWDALLSDRPYRDAWSKEKVSEHIKQESGTHFDPQVVTIFLKMVENI